MILKTIGFYSLLLGVLTNFLFIYVLFGNRSMYFVIIDLSVIGIIASILGLIFDKTKPASMISIALFAAPHMILWIMNAFKKP